MSPSRAALEDHLESYQQKLKSLNSYIKELNDRAAEHSTDRALFEGDLLEAQHNVAYYEAEVSRIKEELGSGAGGGGGAGGVLSKAPVKQGIGALALSALCFAAGVFVGSRLLSGRRED